MKLYSKIFIGVITGVILIIISPIIPTLKTDSKLENNSNFKVSSKKIVKPTQNQFKNAVIEALQRANKSQDYVIFDGGSLVDIKEVSPIQPLNHHKKDNIFTALVLVKFTVYSSSFKDAMLIGVQSELERVIKFRFVKNDYGNWWAKILNN